MVKFIESNRAGKEVILDLKIGYLHAYPNGELQFENRTAGPVSADDEVKGVTANGARMKPRNHLGGTDEARKITEQNLEHLARAMSSGAPSV